MVSEFVAAVAYGGRVMDLPATGRGQVAGRVEAPNAPSGHAAEQVAPGLDQVSQAVEALNEVVQNQKRSLHFSVDQDTGRTIIRVVDPETSRVIRQIPLEEVLNLARHLAESGGVLLRVQA